MSERKWVRGFVTLPCFTIVVDKDVEGEATFTCADWLVWVWRTVFKPFWRGAICIYEEDDNARSDEPR